MYGENYFIYINPVGLSKPWSGWYTDSVGVNLARIYRTASGRVLLDSIRYFKTTIEIQPYTGSTWNARTGIGDQRGGAEGPVVVFSPDSPARSSCCAKGNNAGALPQELLFHELVHAFRFASGKHATGPKVRLPHGVNGFLGYEEFVAVLATNIYISDPTNTAKSKLRGDSDTYRPLDKGLSGSFSYFGISSHSFGLISRFCRENPAFTRKLAGVPANFNPLAAYYKDPDKAMRYSTGSTRDADDIEDDIMRDISAKTYGL